MSSADSRISPMDISASKPTEYGFGKRCGMWLRSNLAIGLFIALVLVCILMAVNVIADAATISATSSLAGTTALYASVMHNKCKGRGGCSRKCPFVVEDDPRVVMEKQVNAIQQLYNILNTNNDKENESMEIEKTKFSSDSKVSAIINDAQLVRVAALTNISTLLIQAKAIDNKYGSSDKVTADVLNAKNTISALQLAADVNKNAFIVAVSRSNSNVMYGLMTLLDDTAQKRILNFDDKITQCATLVSTIDDYYTSVSAKIMYNPKVALPAGSTINTTYALAVNDLLTSVDSQVIIGRLADLLNMIKNDHASIEPIINKYSAISEIYSSSMQLVESFNNSLPGKIDATEVSALIADNNYNEALLKTALEPDVITNHRKFAKERATFDSGGGVPSVLDHDNNLIQWVGLFGRPTYRHSDGSPADKSSEPLRSIPSDNPEDLMRATNPKFSMS